MNKLLAFTVLLVLATALAPATAFADATGGVAGTVVERSTGKPVAGVAVAIYELPANRSKEQDATLVRSLVTDRHGFFSDLGLEPGGYVISADVAGKTSSCAVHAIYNGQVRHVKIVISNDARAPQCEGPYARQLDPDETSDVYRVH
ncbi:MAG: carboxypeptidase-like regulatory domain-containing protein [Vulcanimicrobiaceae bacterium]